MIVEVKVADIAEAAAKAGAAVQRGATADVLSCLRVAVAGDVMLVTGTDMDVAVTVMLDLPRPCERSSMWAVPASRFVQMLGRLPQDAALKIELPDHGTGNTVKLECESFRAELPAIDGAEFPTMEPPDGTRFNIDAKELGRCIRRVLHAASREEARYYLNGIYMHERDGMLVFVATDGHRLVDALCKVDEDIVGMPGIIVPRFAATMLTRLPGGSVSIATDGQRVAVHAGSVTIVSRLIDGQFPDYECVIPKGGTTVTAWRDAMAQAVERVSVIAGDATRMVRLTLTSDRMEIRAAWDGAEASETIGCEWGGEETEIGFNSRYLLDMLRALDGDRFVMSIEAPDAPVLVRGCDDGDQRYVLMPIRF